MMKLHNLMNFLNYRKTARQYGMKLQQLMNIINIRNLWDVLNGCKLMNLCNFINWMK
jgi:hypothetical protein